MLVSAVRNLYVSQYVVFTKTTKTKTKTKTTVTTLKTTVITVKTTVKQKQQ